MNLTHRQVKQFEAHAVLLDLFVDGWNVGDKIDGDPKYRETSTYMIATAYDKNTDDNIIQWSADTRTKEPVVEGIYWLHRKTQTFDMSLDSFLRLTPSDIDELVAKVKAASDETKLLEQQIKQIKTSIKKAILEG